MASRPQRCILLIASLLAISGCATAPRAYVEPPPLTLAARTALNVKAFDTAWRLVDKKYFDPQFRGVDWDALRPKYRPLAAAATDDRELYRVLNAMCAELRESHLSALAPRRAHEIQTARRMAVGMGWVALDGRQVVTELIPDGPAENAGVQLGWIVTTCDGRPLFDGPPPTPQPGRAVTYGFLDLENQPRSIIFQLQLLRFEQSVARELPGGFHYLRFDRFSRDSLHWLSEQLKTHRAAPGVVIDLRENPGGNVFACQVAVGEFFDRTVPTGEHVKRSGAARSSRGIPLLSARYPGRVVVLTGNATGSAAEMFAHVLQHQRRATIVGRRTAGAVIISRSYPLPGGGALQVPIQDYRGLDGQRLEGRGVMPDVVAPRPALADIRTGRDPDLEMALIALAAPDDSRQGRLAAQTERPPETGARSDAALQ